MKKYMGAILLSLITIILIFTGCASNAAPIDLDNMIIAKIITDAPIDDLLEDVAQTTDPSPTLESTPQPTEDTRSPYYIYVEKASHTITIYTMDDNGDYTVVHATYRTGTGKTQGKTPVGIFKLYDYEDRDRWHSFGSGQAWTQYATPFTSGIYFHAALYRYDKISSMYHDQYYEIGTNITAGCLRTTAEAAYFIFNCPPDTTVEIVNGDPKGTTSDPEPSINPDYPHYDPTDPEIPPNQG